MDSERRILVLNAGSSTLKLGLFAWDGEEQLASKNVDWKQNPGSGIESHGDALRYLLQDVDLTQVTAVGHRVVHGGAVYSSSVKIDEEVEAQIERLIELAPLHNPPALTVIRQMKQLLPGALQVASFDTAFHATMRPPEYLYALPYEWYLDMGVRRFGFHGLSHQYCAARAADMLGPRRAHRLVICHLGNGCSLTAVVDGRSVATTMGFTPLEGVMMGTRSGSVDPGLLFFLINQGFLRPEELEHALNYLSGLKGISGVDSDMRAVQQAREEGNERAALALDMFAGRIRQGIGAMAAAAGGVDALVLTAGIGENARVMRQAIAGPLSWLGVNLDHAANLTASPDADIALPASSVRVLIIHTREDLVVARETKRALASYEL